MTGTSAGSSGSSPDSTLRACGASTDSTRAGATSTVALTDRSTESTLPCTVTVPPSREDTMASCSAVRASQATGSSVTSPFDQVTGTVWGSAERASSAEAPEATLTSTAAEPLTSPASGALTCTAALTVWPVAPTLPCTSYIPGTEVSTSPQVTGSLVTSPLDQVTETSAGSSAWPPCQTSARAGASTETAWAGETTTVALTVWSVAPTLP